MEIQNYPKLQEYLEYSKEWKDMTDKEIEWIMYPNLYNDWIDSGKKESFEVYKENRRKEFFNE